MARASRPMGRKRPAPALQLNPAIDRAGCGRVQLARKLEPSEGASHLTGFRVKLLNQRAEIAHQLESEDRAAAIRTKRRPGARSPFFLAAPISLIDQAWPAGCGMSARFRSQETKTKKSRNCLRDLDLPYFTRDFLTGGAEGGIRTPTLLRASAPQAGASASSATSAHKGTSQ